MAPTDPCDNPVAEARVRSQRSAEGVRTATSMAFTPGACLGCVACSECFSVVSTVTSSPASAHALAQAKLRKAAEDGMGGKCWVTIRMRIGVKCKPLAVAGCHRARSSTGARTPPIAGPAAGGSAACT